MKKTLGVVIGRFQTPYLTEGHKALLKEVLKDNDEILVLIGTTEAVGTDKNPLPYYQILNMLEDFFKKTTGLRNCTISCLCDERSDTDWSNAIDEHINMLDGFIENFHRTTIYGGRDNSIEGRYSGKYNTKIIDDFGGESATVIRELVGQDHRASPEFRQGIIYHTQNRYPIVYSTVDVALFNSEGKVLMGRKGDKFHFIGGFVDPDDASTLDAAKRELYEETGIKIKRLQYTTSMKIDDPRYRGTKDSIMTHLYEGDVEELLNLEDAQDQEFTEFRFMEQGNIDLVSETHKPLFKILWKT